MSILEQKIIKAILNQEFPGAAELRTQIDHVKVVAQWAEDSPSVDLKVEAGTATPSGISGVVPVDADVSDDTGTPIGEILLWVTNGFLSGIEYAWYGNEPPTILPEEKNISVKVRPQSD